MIGDDVEKCFLNIPPKKPLELQVNSHHGET